MKVNGTAVTAFTKLTAMGLEPSERALTSYGNTASAMSKTLNQMIEAVADATVGEFERLKEFGIKAAVEGNKVSFTFRGVKTTVKKETAAIQSYLLQLGQTEFAGGMERQANTLNGALSNLGDAWDNLLDRMLDDKASSGIQYMLRSLGELLDYISNTGLSVFQKVFIAGLASIENGFISLKATSEIVWESIKASGMGAINVLKDAQSGLYSGMATALDFVGADEKAANMRKAAEALRPLSNAYDELARKITEIKAARDAAIESNDQAVISVFKRIDANKKEAASLDDVAKKLKKVDQKPIVDVKAAQKAAKALEQFKKQVRDAIDPTAALKETILMLNLALEMTSDTAEKAKISAAIEKMYDQIDEIEELPVALKNSTETMSEFAVQAAREIQTSFADFLFDPFSDGMDGMAYGFARTMHKMASDALAAQLTSKMFGDYGKTGEMGGLVGGFINEFFQFHEGGIVGQGGVTRMTSPLVFAGAPRYHSGGIAGLKPLEMPAILQKGEEVLPRSDPRHAANGGGVPPQFNIAIVDEREALEKFMASPAASPYFVHHIKRNAQVIKGILS